MKLKKPLPPPVPIPQSIQRPIQNIWAPIKEARPGIAITMENEIRYGQLRAKGGKMKLTPLEDHIFKVGDIKERIRFVLDADGNVIGLSSIDSPMELTKSNE